MCKNQEFVNVLHNMDGTCSNGIAPVPEMNVAILGIAFKYGRTATGIDTANCLLGLWWHNDGTLA